MIATDISAIILVSSRVVSTPALPERQAAWKIVMSFSWPAMMTVAKTPAPSFQEAC